MSQVFFTADLHLGHNNVGAFRKNVESSEENTAWIVEQWHQTIRKKTDVVWLLGDIVFDEVSLEVLATLPGRKQLVRGNHDAIKDYGRALEVFENMYGLHTKYHYWLSHAPVHPAELRGKPNIHGHVHYHDIPDPRYVTVSADFLWEQRGEAFLSLPDARQVLQEREEAIEEIAEPIHPHILRKRKADQ